MKKTIFAIGVSSLPILLGIEFGQMTVLLDSLSFLFVAQFVMSLIVVLVAGKLSYINKHSYNNKDALGTYGGNSTSWVKFSTMCENFEKVGSNGYVKSLFLPLVLILPIVFTATYMTNFIEYSSNAMAYLISVVIFVELLFSYASYHLYLICSVLCRACKMDETQEEAIAKDRNWKIYSFISFSLAFLLLLGGIFTFNYILMIVSCFTMYASYMVFSKTLDLEKNRKMQAN